jgi:thioredoxin reductase
MIADKEIVVVGGGDSAIESAILLCKQNKVVLSYRKDKFSRLKPKNREQILAAIEKGWVNVKYNTNLTKFEKQQVTLKYSEDGREEHLKNDLVYIFAGGELPTQFLQKAGVQITKRFGFTMKKYR